MVSNRVILSSLALIILILCVNFCECQGFDTTTISELNVEDASGKPEIIRARGSSRHGHHPDRHKRASGYATSPPIRRFQYSTTTPTKPPNIKIKFPEEKYPALFGGLAGSALGTYLGHQIGKINWEADMPAYSVHHYWHTQGYPLSGDTIVEAGDIVECPQNVSFCVPNSMTMCLWSGKIYCVASEVRTQPCTNSSVGACLPTTIQVKCNSVLGLNCSTTDYEDANVSIPCLKYTRVRYGARTKYNNKFYFPDYKVKIPDNTNDNTCKCNNSKVNITCVKLIVSATEKIFCSGLNLTNLNLITMYSTLNSTNSQKISCLPHNTFASIHDIFVAESKSTLARCEFENSTNAIIYMKCGNIAHLYNSNVSFPADASVAGFRCSIENATNFNRRCQCDNTVTTEVPTTQGGQPPVYSVGYCVIISAYPMRLYNNREYLDHLNTFPELDQESTNVVKNILSIMASYLLF